jgi:hypothetical protein
MFPLGQKLQERLRSPELRSRRASVSAYASSNERARVVNDPTNTGNRGAFLVQRFLISMADAVV